jgi:DNA-binding transcriptional regulator YhcF (GntR family)
MTAVVWGKLVRRQKRPTRRDEIFEWVCRYADEMDGPTPSINEIAVHFKLNYKTVYYHVMKLIVEGRLRQERGKLVVVGSEWIEPSGLMVQQRFDF